MQQQQDLLSILKSIYNTEGVPALPMARKTAAVFQGGGAKGTAFAGAMEAFGDFGVYDQLQQVMGSSAGALTAFLIAIGLDHKQFKKISLDTRIVDLKDADDSGYFGKYLSANIVWAIAAGGMCTGKNARLLISYLIQQTTGKVDCTFSEFENYRIYGKTNPTLEEIEACEFNVENPAHPEMKQFNCTAYHVTDQHDHYFSYKTHPDVIIADALYCSMSLPLVFPGAQIRKKLADGSYEFYADGALFQDGGIADNFPLEYMNKLLTADKDIVVSPELIGFGFADKKDLANLAADEAFAKNIPQETITSLEIIPRLRENSPPRSVSKPNNITHSSTTTSTITKSTPLITTRPEGFIDGSRILYGYNITNQNAIREIITLLKYAKSAVALYTANIESYMLDIDKSIINILVDYGYKHVKHWCTNNKYDIVAVSPEEACPIALKLAQDCATLIVEKNTEIDHLLDSLALEIVREIECFDQYMSNFPEQIIDYSQNIRLKFLGNLLAKIRNYAISDLNLEEEYIEQKISLTVQGALEKYQSLQNRIQKNRQELFPKIDLDTNVIIDRLEAGISDTSEGSDQRFFEIFSYLLSRSYQILNSAAGQTLLESAYKKNQFKKIEHMFTISVHNLMMLNNRFPLKSLKEYFFGYFNTYDTKKDATQSKSSIKNMLTAMLLDSARNGDLTVEHLNTLINVGFTKSGLDIGAIDEYDQRNVLHYCFMNADSVKSVELLLYGLVYLSDNDKFENIMATRDKYGNTPLAYLDMNLFSNEAIRQYIMDHAKTPDLGTNMMKVSKGQILYAAIKSDNLIFCNFILNVLKANIEAKKITASEINFGYAQDSVFLCAARNKNFKILDALMKFRLEYKIYRTEKDSIVDAAGKNPLHYMMEHVNTLEDAKILLDFIHENQVCLTSVINLNKPCFSKSTKGLLSTRDKYGKTPLHYLLENHKDEEVVKEIINTLDAYSRAYDSPLWGGFWHLDEIIDSNVPGNPAPIFKLVKGQYIPLIMTCCKNFSFEFVEKHIIEKLSKKIKMHFKELHNAYEAQSRAKTIIYQTNNTSNHDGKDKEDDKKNKSPRRRM